MAQSEELTTRRRLSPEEVLRDRPVDDDHDRVARGEDVGRLDGRKVTHVPRDDEERNEKKRLLPRCDGVELVPAHTELPELGHRDVVQREPHDEDSDREPDNALRANRRSPPASTRG